MTSPGDGDRERRRGISVVVPMYRTREFLPALLTRLERTLPSGAEILLVDDSCPQESWRDAVTHHPATLQLRVLRIAPNVGQHAAVLLGLARTTYDTVVVMDGDLQDRPEAITELVSHLTADAETDVVCAARHGRYDKLGRRTSATAYRRVAHLLSAGRLPPRAGMFVALRRTAAEPVLGLRDPFAPLLPALASTGASIRAVKIDRAERVGSPSAHTIRSRWRIAIRGLLVLAPGHRLLATLHRRTWDALGVTVDVLPSTGTSHLPRIEEPA